MAQDHIVNETDMEKVWRFIDALHSINEDKGKIEPISESELRDRLVALQEALRKVNENK